MRGLLIKLRDLGLSLIPVHRIVPETHLYHLCRYSATLLHRLCRSSGATVIEAGLGQLT